MIPLDKIEHSKHIVIEVNNENFPQASILYSYSLLLHKKVSLFTVDGISSRYSFLPWFEKLRLNKPSSADACIHTDIAILDLYFFLKELNIKLNKKMATAFYAGFLQEYDNFLSSQCDGIVFAVLSELIIAGADSQTCIRELTQKVPLSVLRLKSIVYKKALLKNNATLAYVELSNEELEASGAKWDDIPFIAKKLLNIAHVEKVTIINVDEKDKIINLSKEI